ncbi:MAG: heparinase II/III family protein [Candidatus Omnitrophica bacterium]|nr:heparinase II/III family protein [Candidatus Omnitrophota bacterium]
MKKRMSYSEIFRTCLLHVGVLSILCMAGYSSASEIRNAYPPKISLDELQKLVAQAPKTHPRLLVSAGELEALRQTNDPDPLTQSLKDAIVHQADSLLDVSPIERKLQGRRLLGQSRLCVQRVIALSTAYHLTGDLKYVQRCEKEMIQAAKFEDWNPSHFLDVAEMTFALAIGYDWLYNQLEEDSRSIIRSAIVQKGVILPFETRHNGWVRSSNNWGQVCHGGLTAGALAVMEHEPELAAKTVHNALQNVTRSMAAFAPKGSYPEGPGYWSYGTTYNVLLIGVLESVLGSDFGLSKAPGFDETGQYLDLVTGPSGYTFNYADGGAGRGSEPAVFWFASRYNRPDWLIHEYDLLSNTIARAKASNRASYGGRFFPFTLLWMKEKADAQEIRMPLHWSSLGHVPITIHRSSWTDPNAVFIGLKAGSPSANHGQMDTGSFVLDADGVRWALDLGAEGYHGIESRGMSLWDRSQNSDRWKIFRQQNFGHNTLVIDDQLQKAENAGVIVQFSDNPDFPHSIVDLTPVYEGQAASVQRGVALLPSNEILIQDELAGLKPNAKVRWGMITRAKPGAADSPSLQLQQDGKSLRMTILSPKESAAWRIIDISKPRNEWDSPNRGTCMAALEKTASADGKATFCVLMTPGSCSESVEKELQITPLKKWSGQ